MPKSKEECFRILGLSPGADEKDIKDAYKRKALELHPDKNPEDPEAAKERFQELQEAFSCLVKEELTGPNITIDMWWIIMMEIERRKEMKRREIESLLRFGFFDFNDHDDGYVCVRRNRSFGRAIPESSRFQRNCRESNHFGNFERQTVSENAGSTDRKSKFTSDHNASNNCSSFDSDWLPEQTSTRSARKKKKNKKNQKKRKVKKIVKERCSRKRTVSRNESTEDSSGESDEGSLTWTVDSVDSNICDKPNEEYVKRIPKDNPEKIKNSTIAEDVGTNLSTGNVFFDTKKCRQEIQNIEAFEKETKNAFSKDIKENNSKINKMNSNTGTSKKEKVKANEENVSRGKRCSDTRISPADFRASKDETRNTSPNWKNNDKRINAERFTKDSRNGENVNETDNEYLYKNQKKNILKQENSAKEEDWNKWKFPNQTASNATIIESGNEEPKSTIKNKRSGKLSKITNQEREGEYVPTKFTNKERDDKKIKNTNEERDGEEMINFSKNKRGGYETQNSSVGKINQELPDSYYIADIGMISYQNGKIYPSHKDLEHEKIKERYGNYIDKLIDPNRTERYNKLIRDSK